LKGVIEQFVPLRPQKRKQLARAPQTAHEPLFTCGVGLVGLPPEHCHEDSPFVSPRLLAAPSTPGLPSSVDCYQPNPHICKGFKPFGVLEQEHATA
jgi:hypothetical protein